MSQPPTGDQNRTPDFYAPGQQPAPVPLASAVPPPVQYPDAIDGLGDPVDPIAAPVEKVGRGILFSLAAIPLGAGLTVAVWQLGFIASITAFAMAAAAIWLYTKGAGAAPSRGALPLVAVIVAGVAASAVGIISAEIFRYLATDYPDLGLGDQLAVVFENLGNAKLWQSYAGDIGMLTLFAALGTFGVIRQLGRAKKV